MGAAVPVWMSNEMANFARLRLAQLKSDPSIRQWLGRAMVLTDSDGRRRVIGSIGFHGPPNAEGKAEIGYRVDPEFRRRGYAREAIRALFDWAYRERGIENFVASISPTNEPSLRLAAEFGFVQVGEQMDEIDGLELVFETRWPPPAASRQLA